MGADGSVGRQGSLAGERRSRQETPCSRGLTVNRMPGRNPEGDSDERCLTVINRVARLDSYTDIQYTPRAMDRKAGTPYLSRAIRSVGDAFANTGSVLGLAQAFLEWKHLDARAEEPTEVKNSAPLEEKGHGGGDLAQDDHRPW